MKKLYFILILTFLLCTFSSCTPADAQVQIAATTLPVFEFTERLCEGTGISVGRVVTENISCLHDYSLQTRQMQLLEGAQVVVINGAGLEDFLALDGHYTIADASTGIPLLCPEESHRHDHNHGHTHETDPHFWLAPEYAMLMAQNIFEDLCSIYPEQSATFQENLDLLLKDLSALQSYGEQALSQLQCRKLITFHDGFAYFAEAFDLTILKAVEEESGSEASAAELIELINLVNDYELNAIFVEHYGSTSAAEIIRAETGTTVYALDMIMSGESYFDSMYYNINTVKEALG